MSKTVVSILPWAGIFHFIVGFMIYSYPNILKSGQRDEVSSVGTSKSYYFSNARIGQAHIIVFILAFAVVILMLVFERPIAALLSLLTKGLTIVFYRLWALIRCKEYEPYVDENDEVIDAPDYYFEINFSQLVKEYKTQKMER